MSNRTATALRPVVATAFLCPILAGIAGLAVGLGAQNLINDMVSGFFILFEEHYLVGDFVKIGEAEGTVESIDLRTTRIRDNAGRHHIIRNGQINDLVNYSKDYTNAVVQVGVAEVQHADPVAEHAFAFIDDHTFGFLPVGHHRAGAKGIDLPAGFLGLLNSRNACQGLPMVSGRIGHRSVVDGHRQELQEGQYDQQ